MKHTKAQNTGPGGENLSFAVTGGIFLQALAYLSLMLAKLVFRSLFKIPICIYCFSKYTV